MNYRRRVRLAVALLGVAGILLLLLSFPREELLLKHIGFKQPISISQGLDIQGGAYLVYEGDVSSVEGDPAEVIKNAAEVIERRVNPSGTTEAIVQTGANNRIIVQLPGVTNINEASQLIGRTATLQFYEIDESGNLLPTTINGQDIKRASLDFPSTGGPPVVSLEFKGGESTEEFADLTTRVSASSGSIITMLDDQVVFGPAQVNEPLTTGQAQLSGSFTVKEAEEVATLLNAGALPVPVKLVAQQQIGPTIGRAALKGSLKAAAIGLVSMALFLIVKYRLLGIVNVISLMFYGLLMLVVIKFSSLTAYPFVMTLAGITGFVLSVALAADAGILIVERYKEELIKRGSKRAAAEYGFMLAWTSIRDANIATVLICILLYASGDYFNVALVKSFASTLLLGVLVGLVVIFGVTRTLLRFVGNIQREIVA